MFWNVFRTRTVGLSSLPKLYSASVPLRHALPHEDGLVFVVHCPRVRTDIYLFKRKELG
jgi:hypothetical protein